jgi:hypothetical protein
VQGAPAKGRKIERFVSNFRNNPGTSEIIDIRNPLTFQLIAEPYGGGDCNDFYCWPIAATQSLH